MSVEDTVWYESHSLKKYDVSISVEFVRNSGTVITTDEKNMTRSG